MGMRFDQAPGYPDWTAMECLSYTRLSNPLVEMSVKSGSDIDKHSVLRRSRDEAHDQATIPLRKLRDSKKGYPLDSAAGCDCDTDHCGSDEIR